MTQDEPDTSTLRAELGGRIGASVTAHLEGDGGPDVRTWRLRTGRSVVDAIADRYDAETAKAWLFGTNQMLDERAPIEVIGGAVSPAELAEVSTAARQFASGA